MTFLTSDRRRVRRHKHVEDHGVVPLPPEDANYSSEVAGSRPDLRPLEIRQPQGPSFALDGHELSWQKWRMRLGFTPREGLVLHGVSYRDQGRDRPILHRASVVDMVVPYGDPRHTYFHRNAFDVGEFGIGTLANSLVNGCDCLGEIRYLDAVVNDSRGGAVTLQNAICVHEEDYGILWKHFDYRSGRTDVARARPIAVRHAFQRRCTARRSWSTRSSRSPRSTVAADRAFAGTSARNAIASFPCTTASFMESISW
jgi:primary-amine oxidase